MGGRRRKRTTHHFNERKKDKIVPNEVEVEKVHTKKQQHIYPVPGLNNLGNTCFFNGVLQNLSQTHFLRQRMSSHLSLESYPLSIPSGCVDVTCREVIVKKEKRPKAESFANDLYQFLVSMVSMSSRTLNPRNIFNHICKNAPRFNSYQQQDSYELLGYLWDALKSEEITRRKLAILESYGVTKSREILKTLTDEERKNIKSYGIQASMMDTYIEDVFGGKLASFITCHSCNTCNTIQEDILDLTLPVPSDKVTSRYPKSKRRIVSNSSDEEEVINGRGIIKGSHNKSEKTLSKHQKKQLMKKERKKARTNKGKNIHSLGDLNKIEECSKVEIHPTVEPAELAVVETTYHDQSMLTVESNIPKLNQKLTAMSLNETCDIYIISDTIDTIDYHENATLHNDSANNIVTLATKDPHSKKILVTGNSHFNEPIGTLATDDPYFNQTIETLITYHSDQPSVTPVNNCSNQPSETLGINDSHSNQLSVTPTSHHSIIPLETPGTNDPPFVNDLHCMKTLSIDNSQPSIISDSCSNQPIQTSATNDSFFNQLTEITDTNNYHCTFNTVLMKREFNREKYEDDEYSLESCLAAFSSPEFLKGNNMFSCQVCTERASNTEEQSTVTETVLKEEKEEFVPIENVDISIIETHKECNVHVTQLKEPVDSSSSSSGCERDESKDTESTKESDDDEELTKVEDTKMSLSKSQIVYCEATKQLLIDSPPPILCIHLKRFTQLGRNSRNLRKNNVHINFGMCLNLMPYCAEKCKELCDSTGCLMYSLYGVVVHSGSMHGGHYTSYVRKRKELSLDSVAKIKYTENDHDCDQENDEKTSTLLDKVHYNQDDQTGCTNNPLLFDYSSTENSQWYYISDTHVAKASPDDVLQSQAYLLFYERLPFIQY